MLSDCLQCTHPLPLSPCGNTEAPQITSRQIKFDNSFLFFIEIEERAIVDNICTSGKGKFERMVFCGLPLSVLVLVRKFIQDFSLLDSCCTRCCPYLMEILGISGRRIHQPPSVFIRCVPDKTELLLSRTLFKKIVGSLGG